LSLTVFVDRKSNEIGIVEWFRDPKFNLTYPVPPLHRMSNEDFRASGYNWIRKHFAEYGKRRVSENEAEAVFAPGEERKYLRKQHAIRLYEDAERTVWMMPLRFRKFDLGGFESMGPETRHQLRVNYSEKEFWTAFDQVLGAAE
jgi:hypothetical protein